MRDTEMKFEKKKILFFLAVLSASLLCAYASSLLLEPAPIDVSMTVQLPSSGRIKIFYLLPDAGYWQEKNSLVSPKLPGGKVVSVNFKIPVKKLKRMRIDFEHTQRGECTISNLALTGSSTFTLSESGNQLRISETYDINTWHLEGKSLSLQIGQHDPHFVLSTSHSLKSGKKIDFFLICCVFVLSFMLFSGIGICVQKLLVQKKDWADLMLATAFCLIICIPAQRIDKSAVSLSENRILAPLPRISTPEGKINTDFGREFEKYFNDRFRGRGKVLKCYQRLKSFVNGIGRRYAVSDAVVEGKDQWFFYRLENSIRNFQNLDVLTEKEMKEALQVLRAQDAWCKKNNIKFYYFIAPDKNKVYGENMTFVPRINPDSRSRTALWVDYIRKNSDIKVVYPLEELKKQKHKGLLYYKKDTHWNWLGGYFGYNTLIKLVRETFPDLRTFKAEKFTEEKGRVGDLYCLAPHIVGKETEVYKKPVIEEKFSFPVNYERSYHFKNPEGKGKVWVLRDSFSNVMLAYMFYTFAEVTAHWRFYLSSEDLAEMVKQETSIFILEHVERNLPYMIDQMRKKSVFKVDKE